MKQTPFHLSLIVPIVLCAGSARGQNTPALPQANDAAITPEIVKEESPERSKHMSATGFVPTAMESLRKQAGMLRSLAVCRETKAFINATSWLPVDVPRVIYKRSEPKAVLSAAQFEALPKDQRTGYQGIELDDYTYYYTRYGSPLAYLRPVEILCQTLGGENALRTKRVLDYGYGGVGHLRLLASIGCDVTGVDIDPVLAAMYSLPEDQGEAGPATLADDTMPIGKLALVDGLWPGNDAVAARVGTGYDVILSKNTLKKGFINPSREANARTQVNLSVDQPAFVQALADALKPGGVLLVYNICPAPASIDKPFIPWAEGEFPFPRAMVEAAGFEVLAWDLDDTTLCRAVAKALEWDQGEGAMDLENDLVVKYTLLRKRISQTAPAAAAP